MADVLIVMILTTAAFLLGACPFSLWIGKLILRKDIRDYGDGNPGASNVFKAGGKWWGVVAIIADIAKGIPFVSVAKIAFGLSQPITYLIAMAAMSGHAYSPFLNFKGGKALAVFAGTLLALSQWDVIICLAILFFIGFLLIGNDSWIVILGTLGTLTIMVINKADTWEVVFIIAVTLIFVIKQFTGLQDKINQPGRLINWIRSRRKTA